MKTGPVFLLAGAILLAALLREKPVEAASPPLAPGPSQAPGTPLPPRPAAWGEPFAGTWADARGIHGFVGEYRWLSNFYPCRVSWDGLTYGSAEAVYQSAKFPPSQRAPYARLGAAAAKKLAHAQKIDEAWWDARKDGVMREALLAKFIQNPDLRARLLATGGRYLEETNWWDDTYWGVYHGQGKNTLGRLLMEVRDRLRNSAGPR